MGRPLGSFTVEELAALCGLTRDSVGDWTGKQPWAMNPCVISHSSYHNTWAAYGVKGCSLVEDATEHAALLSLARHLNLTQKEPTMTPTRYVKIERDPATDDYTDYQPREGDRWCFGNGKNWTVSAGSMSLYVGPEVDVRMYSVSHKHIRDLTTHIERPVRTVTVPKEGYQPKVGDRFCGPEGVVLTVSSAERCRTCFDGISGGFHRDPVTVLVNLCTRIERDA